LWRILLKSTEISLIIEIYDKVAYSAWDFTNLS
jgi:hypothetical protein